MDVNVKVAVRCRPMSTKEIARGCSDITIIEENTIQLKSPDDKAEEKGFTFDYCYGGDSTQTQVYTDLGLPLITQAIDGFNGTIFAYGQTGSGKTFSMMGTDDNKGIIPQLNDDLWVKIENKKLEMAQSNREDANSYESDTKFMVMASFLEVYNEEIKDLLNPSDKKMKIHESPKLGIYVEGLCELIVRDATDLLKLIYQGNTVRKVASTNMNDTSSRSHSVFTIKIERKTTTELKGGMTREHVVKAKVNLVDLAGSERASKTGASGQTLKEGANINLSLMTLGNVINALAEGSTTKKGAKKVIPYRNSKLTRLLQESLGGNSATLMIASISPADYNYAETMGTLKYANRAKSIANAVTRNEDANERMVRDLKNQIEELKRKLEAGGVEGTPVHDPELEKRLKEMEASQHDAWAERERLSRALEEERQANLNTVISGMMQGVKDQKVQHMKNIKRLTNEKALISKQFKETKDHNATLKLSLDRDIHKYQELQKAYDDAMLSAEAAEAERETADGELKEEAQRTEEQIQKEEEKQQKAEEVANEMIELLTKIEDERLKYTEKRDDLKRMRTRLEKIEEEITDERAELVATAGVLNQNDRLRAQIQEEEREKVKAQIEEEIARAKEQLDKERESAIGTIQGEMQGEMDKLRGELAHFRSLLKMEESKNEALVESQQQAERYAESLELRLADSEVAHETAVGEIDRLNRDKEEIVREKEQVEEGRRQVEQEFAAYRKEQEEAIAALQAEHAKALEEAKFDMFKRLMDGFVEERKLLQKKHKDTQDLLSQAAKDVMFLSQKNQELSTALNQAIYYEPTINH